MSNSFQPQTAFEGYVARALEDIGNRLNRLPCDTSSKRLSKVENDIANIKGKATIFGAISGIIAGILTKIFMNK